MNDFSGVVLTNAARCCFRCLLGALKIDDEVLKWITHAPFRVEHYKCIQEFKEMQHFFKDIQKGKIEIIQFAARMILAKFGKTTVSHERFLVRRNVPTNIRGFDDKLNDGFKTGQVYAFLKDTKTCKTSDWVMSCILDATLEGSIYPLVGVITTSHAPQYLNETPFGVIHHKIVPHPAYPVFDTHAMANIVKLFEKGPNLHTIIIDHVLRVYDPTIKGEEFEPSIAFWLDILTMAFKTLTAKTIILVLDSSTFIKHKGAEDQLKAACHLLKPHYQLTTIVFDDEDPSEWSVKKFVHPVQEESIERAL